MSLDNLNQAIQELYSQNGFELIPLKLEDEGYDLVGFLSCFQILVGFLSLDFLGTPER